MVPSIPPYEKIFTQSRRNAGRVEGVVKQVAGRVGWRHKASAEAYRVIANPPRYQLFLVGWLFQG